jgi:hypothetical protein
MRIRIWCRGRELALPVGTGRVLAIMERKKVDQM